MKLTEDQITIAARMLKVLKLVNMPGMDEVAVKLNCGLTYDEEQTAKRWAKAFEIASDPQHQNASLFDLASELYHAR